MLNLTIIRMSIHILSQFSGRFFFENCFQDVQVPKHHSRALTHRDPPQIASFRALVPPGKILAGAILSGPNNWFFFLSSVFVPHFSSFSSFLFSCVVFFQKRPEKAAAAGGKKRSQSEWEMRGKLNMCKILRFQNFSTTQERQKKKKAEKECVFILGLNWAEKNSNFLKAAAALPSRWWRGVVPFVLGTFFYGVLGWWFFPNLVFRKTHLASRFAILVFFCFACDSML